MAVTDMRGGRFSGWISLRVLALIEAHSESSGMSVYDVTCVEIPPCEDVC